EKKPSQMKRRKRNVNGPVGMCGYLTIIQPWSSLDFLAAAWGSQISGLTRASLSHPGCLSVLNVHFGPFSASVAPDRGWGSRSSANGNLRSHVKPAASTSATLNPTAEQV